MPGLKLSLLLLFPWCALGVNLNAKENTAPIDFGTQVRPIFAQHCVACHGGVKQAGGLSFVYPDNVFAGGDSGMPTVQAGDPAGSYLLERVNDSDPESRMPPAEHGPPLSPREIATLTSWIEQGAKWDLPWAFVAPRQPQLPPVQQAEWCLKPVDRFVLARLESSGLKPSPPANRSRWLRRVSFDLIGLPPTPAEVEDFLSDSRDDAFERVVDRLLASPQFGGRWASMWLDVARYADTTGYEKDLHRDIWPYRDWVIRAFNADMPFDKFTIRQLAGDLLEGATIEDRLATAFHRNTQTNTEGGTDDEEFRTAAVIDRVNTTWQVWQATTFGCTQCHSHPYEPIEHEEYYRFLAVFNNSRDSDIDEDLPRLDVPLEGNNNVRSLQLLRRKTNLRRTTHEHVSRLATNERVWQNLAIDHAQSTGSTRLAIRQSAGEIEPHLTEVTLENAATSRSAFTLEAPISSDIKQLTALRIDALLRDIEGARKLPEMGFVLSHLKASILPPGGGEPVELKFSHAFSDEPEPLLDPAASLAADDQGWGSYSRIWRPQFAVFLLERGVPIVPQSRIRLELVQNRSTSGEVALVLNRSRYALSSSNDWIRLQQDPKIVSAQRELAQLNQQQQAIDHLSVPVMAELPTLGKRSTFVFTRGLWLDKGEPVEPGTPAILPPLPPGTTVDRLAVARWFVADENPLTARVMVNRIWAQLFGTGIVETAEDFGTSGTYPSHPELLDHLALQFRDDFSWSLKQLLREIVLSATYRQRSQVLPEHLQSDPENRQFSRGPRQRLTAEMVRDQAVVLSGSFSPKMFGPPVMPPQPEGIWRSIYSGAKWTNATGEDRFRRAIYTYWKRTSGYPSMVTFDVPSREVCTARRIATNTPLQALVTLNDEAFVECAQGFAKQIASHERGSEEERISWAYLRATGDKPSPASLGTLKKLLESSRAYYAENTAEAAALGGSAEQASYVILASTILNLDEALSK